MFRYYIMIFLEFEGDIFHIFQIQDAIDATSSGYTIYVYNGNML